MEMGTKLLILYLIFTAEVFASLLLYTFTVFLKILFREGWGGAAFFIRSRNRGCSSNFHAWMDYVFLAIGSTAAIAVPLYVISLSDFALYSIMATLVPISAAVVGFMANPSDIVAILPPELKIYSFEISLRHPFGLTGFIFRWKNNGFVPAFDRALRLVFRWSVMGLIVVTILWLVGAQMKVG